jgi:RTC4-like domain
MARMSEVPDGYYGSVSLTNQIGADVILHTLVEMFPRISATQSDPQTVPDFTQLVLLPEAIARLICDDYDWTCSPKSLEKAYTIQRESADFGKIVYFSYDAI